MLQGFVGPPPVDPVTAAIAAAMTIISFLLGRSGSLKDALASLSAFTIRGFAGVFNLFGSIWNSVLKPALLKLEQLARQAHRIYNRVIRPILENIERIRDTILRLYTKFVRPILEITSALRKFLAITRLSRTKLGRALDRRIQRLEQRITEPVLVALKTINDHARLLNVVLTAGEILQSVTHLRSLVNDAGGGAHIFYNTQSRALSAAEEIRLAEMKKQTTPAEVVAATRELLTKGTGPLAGDLADGLNLFLAIRRA